MYIRVSEQDRDNAIRNLVTIIGSGGPAYNAVIAVEFSDEAPAEPVTLQEAKDWCRIDVADDDALILALISGARVICEKQANISFIERTVTSTLNNGLGNIRLPYGPVTSDVAYYNEDDSEATDYSLSNPGTANITAVYSAGYAAGELPQNLRTALLNQIAWCYENRGDAAVAGKLSEQAKLILNQVRRV